MIALSVFAVSGESCSSSEAEQKQSDSSNSGVVSSKTDGIENKDNNFINENKNENKKAPVKENTIEKKTEEKNDSLFSQEPNSSCDHNYTGACVPIASDVDCAGGSGNGPEYVAGPVRVIGQDIYDLDRDGNGIGCEN